MAKAKHSLLEEVRAGLPSRRGLAPWYETLPEDVMREVEEIVNLWLAGTLDTTKTALGHQLSKSLKKRGHNIGHSGIIQWLGRQQR